MLKNLTFEKDNRNFALYLINYLNQPYQLNKSL